MKKFCARSAIVLAALFSFTACGDGSVGPRDRNTRARPPIPSDNPAVPAPIGGGGGGEEETASGFTLLGPELPAGVTIARQQARLTAADGTTYLVESTHPGEAGAAAPLAVSAGTYSVTFLDENGADTPIVETVTIAAGETATLPVGSVWITPESAVQLERAGTGALQFRLSNGTSTLRTVPGSLDTVIDVPAGQALQWFGLGVDGELPPVTFNPGSGLLQVEFGSIYVRKNIADSVQIRGANGVTLFPETGDFVEYLVPATTQTQGCMVYQGVVNQLTTQTFSLCTDAVRHVILDAR